MRIDFRAVHQRLSEREAGAGDEVDNTIGEAGIAECLLKQARQSRRYRWRANHNCIAWTSAAPVGAPVNANGKLNGLMTSHTR